MQLSKTNLLGTKPIRTLLLLSIVMGFSLGCTAELEPPPDEILGIWSTDAPSHAGRTFEIRTDSIRFGTGEHSAPAILSMIGVEQKQSPEGEKTFVIHHRESDGSESETALAYRAGKKPGMTAGTGPSLRFVNRKEIWTRTTRVASDE